MGGINYNLTELLRHRNYSQKLYEGTVNEAVDDTKDDPFDVGPFKEGTFFLNVSAFVGTNVIVTILTLDPVSLEWHVIATFETLTDVGKDMKPVTANLGEKIAVVVTPTGAGAKTLTVGANFKIM